MKKLSFILIAFFLVNFIIHGATYTSSQSGSWTASATWGGAGPPSGGDIVIIKATHAITANSEINPGSLTIKNNGSLNTNDNEIKLYTSGGTVLIEGTLTAKTLLMENNNQTLIITSTGTVTLSAELKSDNKPGSSIIINGSVSAGHIKLNGTDITGSGCATAGSYDLSGGSTVFGNSNPSGEECGDGTHIWEGDVSTDWNIAGNWNINDVPGTYNSALIPSTVITYEPSITGAVSNIDAVTIESGRVLTIESGGQFSVIGKVINNAGNSGLVVKSTSSGTGSLIHSTTGVGGTVERYMSTAGYWHYMTTPIDYSSTGSTFSTLGMGLTGGAGFDQFYYWDESYVSGSFTGWWIDILNSALYTTEVFNLGQGYALSYYNSSPILSFAGKMNVASTTVGVTYTEASTFAGANLIGNPFTSTIAINSGTNNFLADNSSILPDANSAIYLWEEVPGWTQTVYTYVTITNLNDPTYLEPGQGFMVMVDETTSVSFNSDIRAHGTASFYKDGGEISRFELNVSNPEGMPSSTLIGFKDGMTNGLDKSWDGGKLFGNPDLGLYTRLVEDNGIEFAVQALPPANEETTVKLGLRAQITGEYTFRPSTIENFIDEVSIILEDKQTGAMVDFSDPSASYTFNIDSPGDFDSRFELHFTTVVGINDPSSISPNKNIQTYVAGNTLHVIDDGAGSGRVEIFNLLGRQLMQESYENSYNTFSLDLAAGSYIVRVISDGSNISNKIYVN